jgi:hypothetical protein
MIPAFTPQEGAPGIHLIGQTAWATRRTQVSAWDLTAGLPAYKSKSKAMPVTGRGGL